MTARRAIWVLGLLAACARPPEGGARGRAPRVVSLHDVTTELVVALGLVDRLVGIAAPVDLPAGTRAALAGIPEVGGPESILSVKPGVVLGLEVVGEQDPALVRALRAAGIDVVLAGPRRLDDTIALVREVAARAGDPVAGERLAARLEKEGDAGTPRSAAATEPAAVFVYDCCDPPFTTGSGTVLADLIRRAGGRNVFDDLDAGWTHVSWEEVVARRPRLVVIHDYAHEGQADVDGKRARLGRFAALAGSPVVVLPLRASLGGLGSFEGLGRLRAALEGVR